MREMPSDDELILMANRFDEFALDFCKDYDIGPLEMTGLFLARMSRMAQELEYNTEYKKILGDIVRMNETTQTIMANNNSTSLH